MKHAFLIMIHENFGQVARLIKKLDNQWADIYIHVDKKALFTKEDEEMLKNSCKESSVYFSKRISVTWGGYSQIVAYMQLLKEAAVNNYDYYHLISGVDFPVKPMSYIYDFFERNNGTEFIQLADDEFVKRQHFRLAYYHFFREKIGRKRCGIYYTLERISLGIQRILHVDRTRKYPNIKVMMGGCWYSITDALAKYVLSEEKQIEKMYKHTSCCDESYLQTIAYNSKFKENIFCIKENVSANDAFLRYVDWTRPGKNMNSPYDLTVDDYDKVVSSGALFARKISDKTEGGKKLIEKLELL